MIWSLKIKKTLVTRVCDLQKIVVPMDFFVLWKEIKVRKDKIISISFWIDTIMQAGL